MSLVIVETQYDEPVTFDRMNEEEERLVPCLTARQATWQYSLLADDRHRTLCIYEALDAESVRRGYRTAQVFFSRTWSGERIEPQGVYPEPPGPSRIVMEATYGSLSQEEWQGIQHQLLHHFSDQNIDWFRVYRSLDRTTAIWELNAPDVQTVQKAQQQANVPCNRIWSADLLNPEIWAELGFATESNLQRFALE